MRLFTPNADEDDYADCIVPCQSVSQFLFLHPVYQTTTDIAFTARRLEDSAAKRLGHVTTPAEYIGPYQSIALVVLSAFLLVAIAASASHHVKKRFHSMGNLINCRTLDWCAISSPSSRYTTFELLSTTTLARRQAHRR